MSDSPNSNRADLPSSAQLVRSTILSVVAAAALLIVFILPSEYGVDPTGIGSVLGITQTADTRQAEGETSPGESGSIASTVDLPQERRSDEVTVTLAPGEAAEVKLVMIAGGVASYEWSADKGYLNFDMHAEGSEGQSISYKQGRAAFSDSGDLEAAFDGNHGWYWRNRSDETLTITLKAEGEFSDIKRVL